MYSQGYNLLNPFQCTIGMVLQENMSLISVQNDVGNPVAIQMDNITHRIHANIGGILMGSMLWYIWILWVMFQFLFICHHLTASGCQILVKSAESNTCCAHPHEGRNPTLAGWNPNLWWWLCFVPVIFLICVLFSFVLLENNELQTLCNKPVFISFLLFYFLLYCLVAVFVLVFGIIFLFLLLLLLLLLWSHCCRCRCHSGCYCGCGCDCGCWCFYCYRCYFTLIFAFLQLLLYILLLLLLLLLLFPTRVDGVLISSVRLRNSTGHTPSTFCWWYPDCFRWSQWHFERRPMTGLACKRRVGTLEGTGNGAPSLVAACFICIGWV